jgi:hypothetical protein
VLRLRYRQDVAQPDARQDGDTEKEQLHPGARPGRVDLRYGSGSTITMQTPPLYEPWAPARRNYAAYGTRIPPAGPIVPPGKYTIRVKAGAAEQTTGRSSPMLVL